MPLTTLQSRPRLHVQWHDLISANSNSEDFPSLLETVLSNRGAIKGISKLEGSEMVSVLDMVDRAMASPYVSTRMQKKCILVLRKLCGSCGTLPNSHMIKDGLEKTDENALTGGAFADVWRGTYNGKPVAIKSFRIYGNADLFQVKKRFCKEAVIWKRLSHPNLLPYLGASTTLFQLCVVSAWMENGTICEHLKAVPTANRLALLTDVARGLDYLHSVECVHGDLKGANILINSDFKACIADFGLMSVKTDPNTTNASTNATASLGSTRWMCPELLNPEEYGLTRTNPTLESDMYALGMVVYEVFAGTPPFHGMRDAAVIHRVLSGIRPDRPPRSDALGLDDILWEIVQTCWRTKWDERPAIGALLKTLENAVKYWVPPPPLPEEAEKEENGSDHSFLIDGSSSSDLDILNSVDGDDRSSDSSSELALTLDFPQVIVALPESRASEEFDEEEQDASSQAVSEYSVIVVHQGHSLNPDEVVPALTPRYSSEDAIQLIETWLMKQNEYMRSRGGRRLRPGVVVVEEPTYIDSSNRSSTGILNET